MRRPVVTESIAAARSGRQLFEDQQHAERYRRGQNVTALDTDKTFVHRGEKSPELLPKPLGLSFMACKVSDLSHDFIAFHKRPIIRPDAQYPIDETFPRIDDAAKLPVPAIRQREDDSVDRVLQLTRKIPVELHGEGSIRTVKNPTGRQYLAIWIHGPCFPVFVDDRDRGESGVSQDIAMSHNVLGVLIDDLAGGSIVLRHGSFTREFANAIGCLIRRLDHDVCFLQHVFMRIRVRTAAVRRGTSTGCNFPQAPSKEPAPGDEHSNHDGTPHNSGEMRYAGHRPHAGHRSPELAYAQGCGKPGIASAKTMASFHEAGALPRISRPITYRHKGVAG